MDIAEDLGRLDAISKLGDRVNRISIGFSIDSLDVAYSGLGLISIHDAVSLFGRELRH